MNSALEVIARFENALDAELARGQLESEGIPSFLLDAHTVTMNWMLSNAVGGVKLAVHPRDAHRARDVLGNEVQADQSDSGWGACPNCGSRNLEPRFDRRVTGLSWLLFGIPLLFPKKSFFCHACKQSTATTTL